MGIYFSQYTGHLSEVLSRIDAAQIDQLYDILDHARAENHQVFLLGNGGSAATAAHWVCDFAKGASVSDCRRLRVFALSDNTPIITAYGNDLSYSDIFVEQLKNYMQQGDIVLSMSVSGSSPNLLAAHKYAQSLSCRCISIIGDYDGALRGCSDFTIVIPSKNYGVVEDAHLIIGHILSQKLRKDLCGTAH